MKWLGALGRRRITCHATQKRIRTHPPHAQCTLTESLSNSILALLAPYRSLLRLCQPSSSNLPLPCCYAPPCAPMFAAQATASCLLLRCIVSCKPLTCDFVCTVCHAIAMCSHHRLFKGFLSCRGHGCWAAGWHCTLTCQTPCFTKAKIDIAPSLPLHHQHDAEQFRWFELRRVSRRKNERRRGQAAGRPTICCIPGSKAGHAVHQDRHNVCTRPK